MCLPSLLAKYGIFATHKQYSNNKFNLDIFENKKFTTQQNKKITTQQATKYCFASLHFLALFYTNQHLLLKKVSFLK